MNQRAAFCIPPTLGPISQPASAFHARTQHDGKGVGDSCCIPPAPNAAPTSAYRTPPDARPLTLENKATIPTNTVGLPLCIPFSERVRKNQHIKFKFIHPIAACRVSNCSKLFHFAQFLNILKSSSLYNLCQQISLRSGVASSIALAHLDTRGMISSISTTDSGQQLNTSTTSPRKRDIETAVAFKEYPTSPIPSI